MASIDSIRIVGLAALTAALVAGPAVAQDPEYVAIKAGRIITVSGEVLSPGVIVIEDGMITAVGAGLEFPASADVIEAPRATVMPGIILPRTRYGLVDFNRTGVHGDQRASSEVYLDTIPFDELLAAGITTACFVPTGRDIPGMASIYMTAGDRESRLVRDPAYLDVRANNKKTLRDALKKAQAEIDKVEKARKEWEEKQKKKKAEEEARKKDSDPPPDDAPEDEPEEQPEDRPQPKPTPGADDPEGEPGKGPNEPAGEQAQAKEDDDTFKPPPIDPKYQPLVDLIQHKDGARMMARVQSAADLLHLDDTLERYDGLACDVYLATRSASDLHHVVQSLGERQARVVMRPGLHFMPQTRIRYNLIEDLAAAGCDVSIVPQADRRDALEDMRQLLASVVRAGLDEAEAYKMLTANPARLLGLDDRMGTIEKDRRADLVFFDGDPLDPHSTVTRVLILGKTVYNADDGE